MITDNQTNFLYLADTLPVKHPDFYKEFQSLVLELEVPFSLLPTTKDIWAVDYMHIQLTKERFIQFDYNPDYLRATTKWRKTITDAEAICIGLGLSPKNLV